MIRAARSSGPAVRMPAVLAGLSWPYQETTAFMSGLWAAKSSAYRPPRQNPVMPIRSGARLRERFYMATIASRSAITRASGTLLATFSTAGWSASCSTPPSRA